MISNFQISNHTLGEADIHRRGHSLKQTPTVLDTGYHFVYCQLMSAMANRIQKMNQLHAIYESILGMILFTVNKCPLRQMSALMNVHFDECPL